jgi:hypothetical protein
MVESEPRHLVNRNQRASRASVACLSWMLLRRYESVIGDGNNPSSRIAFGISERIELL